MLKNAVARTLCCARPWMKATNANNGWQTMVGYWRVNELVMHFGLEAGAVLAEYAGAVFLLLLLLFTFNFLMSLPCSTSCFNPMMKAGL